jgi:hypothetical protein
MVVPSRPLEKMVEVLVRADPTYARSAREKEQADEVYSGGMLRVGIHLNEGVELLTKKPSDTLSERFISSSQHPDDKHESCATLPTLYAG